ncbi:GNAT family N-acetyltransferase [Flavobacterium sp.]|jgi:L-amino acid N-acyltransferase YncA|uniref:GNAT family N-acetyltransferase n=1 Tax=Flavobacterium sp. TaxID=239 RepID=UPI00262AF891|nr:GNAT family N-acetyltransferase [Flavobacterium sp.]
MQITIRPYSRDDAPAILAIVNYNILHTTALYDYAPRSLAQQELIFDEKLKKGFPIYVAVMDNDVVGFGYYSEFRFREAYKFTAEHSVYAHPNWQRKGIGNRLLLQLIETAKKQGLHTLIGVVDAENIDSIAFHERMGFEIKGVLHETGFKFDRWLHSVFMQRILK